MYLLMLDLSQTKMYFFAKLLLYKNSNNFVISKFGARHKYQLKVHTKLEINPLNRATDFVSTRSILTHSNKVIFSSVYAFRKWKTKNRSFQMSGLEYPFNLATK